jgi:hypothetical protein
MCAGQIRPSCPPRSPSAGCAHDPAAKPPTRPARRPPRSRRPAPPPTAQGAEAFGDPALVELLARARKGSPDLALARGRRSSEAVALPRAADAGDQPALSPRGGPGSLAHAPCRQLLPLSRRASPAAPMSPPSPPKELRGARHLWAARRRSRRPPKPAASARREVHRRRGDLRWLLKSCASGSPSRCPRTAGLPRGRVRHAPPREGRARPEDRRRRAHRFRPAFFRQPRRRAQAKVDEGLGRRRLAAAENALRALIGATPGEALPLAQGSRRDAGLRRRRAFGTPAAPLGSRRRRRRVSTPRSPAKAPARR